MKKAMWMNLLIVLLEIPGFVLAIQYHGAGIFKFYTQDSNLILMIAALLYFLFHFLHRKEENYKIPEWLCIFKYVSTCLITVTFMIVLLVLAPMEAKNGWKAVLATIAGGSSFFHHFVCPIMAIVTYLFLETERKPSLKDNIIAIIPTFIYAIVTIILNVTKVLYGPYAFLHVYEQSVAMSVFWTIFILGTGYLFAFLIRKLARRSDAQEVN